MASDSPDPAALLRRLEELKQSYRDSCTIEDVRSLDNALHDLLPTDLIPIVRRAVELEGENATLLKALDDNWVTHQRVIAAEATLSTARESAAEWRDKFKRAELHLSVARACAAVALESLGITPGPDPVAELCGVVPGMVAKMRDALEPFANYVDIRGSEMPDETLVDETLCLCKGTWRGPTLGDCRRAAAALARETNDGR